MLQTSHTKFTRVFEFDQKIHEQALYYTNWRPLNLVGVTEQDGKLFVNQTTYVVQVNASDMNFEHQPPQDEKSPAQIMVAADINVPNIHKRRHNQRECPRGNNHRRLTTKGSNKEQRKSGKTERGLYH